mgnify:FL=1|tara:strand:+ start:67 stop:261 length:195 start_codon:yes stop_codon:yes gene_type:complete
MSNYNNKKKNNKKFAKEKARKAKQARRSRFIKEEHRLEKTIESIKWKNRSRIKPYRKPKEEEDA